MAARKKKIEQPGPIEKQLQQQLNATKAAQRKASQPIDSITLPIEVEPFFSQNKKHKYGTCWQCGTARKTAGGLPNTGDAYWCDSCKCYLTIRHDRKDAAKIPIKTDKK